MRYLKKVTVKTVIDLASACPPEGELTPEEIRAGMMGHLVTDPSLKAYISFVTNLGEEERAELTALMWLGRNPDRNPADFQDMVAHALGRESRDLFDEQKQKLPQYLRYGMERLARHQSKKRVSLQDEARRRQVIGRFVLEHFEKTYGREHGRHRLITLMLDHGYLSNPEDRALFNLPEDAAVSELDKILSHESRRHKEIKLQPLK